MFWALVKKQLAEIWSKNRKTKNGKKPRSSGVTIALFSVLFFFLAVMFFFMSMGLFFALGEVGLESLYFCLVSVLAVALGVFGSVFNTYSSLYLARDNESLLAMPIPPIYIIASRLVSDGSSVRGTCHCTRRRGMADFRLAVGTVGSVLDTAYPAARLSDTCADLRARLCRCSYLIAS